MSKIKELFFREAFIENRNVVTDDVERLVDYLNNVGDEGTQFDAKDVGKIIDPKRGFSLDKVKMELGKHVSAFANSSGGLIAIGVREDRYADQSFEINSFDLGEINLQHLQRALSTSVEPKAEFSVESVDMGTVDGITYGIILLFIEQSETPPHQVLYNKTYYFRHGESSNPAPHSLVAALFRYRRQARLEIDLIKMGNPDHLRVLIKNKGNAPAHHTHIIINIFPRLMDENGKPLLNKRVIERTTDGLWNIKSSLGDSNQNSMKFRFRARPEQIILPDVNEILFDLPFDSYEGAKLTADIFCDGFTADHQEFTLD